MVDSYRFLASVATLAPLSSSVLNRNNPFLLADAQQYASGDILLHLFLCRNHSTAWAWRRPTCSVLIDYSGTRVAPFAEWFDHARRNHRAISSNNESVENCAETHYRDFCNAFIYQIR